MFKQLYATSFLYNVDEKTTSEITQTNVYGQCSADRLNSTDGPIKKITGGAGNDCLNLNFRQNFP